jgi:small subunit ribosomal protein S11
MAIKKKGRKEKKVKSPYLYLGKLDPYIFRRTAKKAKKLATIFGVFNLRLTRKNSLANVADLKGRVLYWRSAGTVGYASGKKRRAPHVTSLLSSILSRKAAFNGIKFAKVVLRGSKVKNKVSFIKSIGRAGIKIVTVRDFSNTPYNGCRPPKARRKK